MKQEIPDLLVGEVYEMVWPFHLTRWESRIGINEVWNSGCKNEADDLDDAGYQDFYLIAHGEGKIIYEILSIAKMPEKFLDRVIFRCYKIDPDGIKTRADYKMVSVNVFIRHINSRTPFRADYELEERERKQSN